jgi:hypothetical protein
MRYDMKVAIFGEYADVAGAGSAGLDADVANWDGFWIWDHPSGATRRTASLAHRQRTPPWR